MCVKYIAAEAATQGVQWDFERSVATAFYSKGEWEQGKQKPLCDQRPIDQTLYLYFKETDQPSQAHSIHKKLHRHTNVSYQSSTADPWATWTLHALHASIREY